MCEIGPYISTSMESSLMKTGPGFEASTDYFSAILNYRSPMSSPNSSEASPHPYHTSEEEIETLVMANMPSDRFQIRGCGNATYSDGGCNGSTVSTFRSRAEASHTDEILRMQSEDVRFSEDTRYANPSYSSHQTEEIRGCANETNRIRRANPALVLDSFEYIDINETCTIINYSSGKNIHTNYTC